MYALRERRVHVTQEDFEMAVAKVLTHAHKYLHVHTICTDVLRGLAYCMAIMVA